MSEKTLKQIADDFAVVASDNEKSFIIGWAESVGDKNINIKLRFNGKMHENMALVSDMISSLYLERVADKTSESFEKFATAIMNQAFEMMQHQCSSAEQSIIVN